MLQRLRRADTGELFGYVFALAWLAFLILPLADVAATGSRAEIAASILGVAAFAAIYAWFWIRVRSTEEARGTPVAMWPLLVLALVLTLAGGDRWIYTFIYVAVLAATGYETRGAVISVAGITALVAALALLLREPPLVAVFIVFLVGMMGAMTAAVARLIGAHADLSRAQDEIARLAVADERARIAGDVHDLLGHSLSVIVLKAELASRLGSARPEQAAAETRDIERVARDALKEVREAVSGYRQPTLALELDGARSALRAAGIRGTVDPAGRALPIEVEAVLAWTVREGVTNVVRHSHARHCRIRLDCRNGTAELEVLDDGRGPAAAGTGTGLRGLTERVEARGGSMAAGRRRGGGFRLAVSLPIEAEAG